MSRRSSEALHLWARCLWMFKSTDKEGPLYLCSSVNALQRINEQVSVPRGLQLRYQRNENVYSGSPHDIHCCSYPKSTIAMCGKHKYLCSSSRLSCLDNLLLHCTEGCCLCIDHSHTETGSLSKRGSSSHHWHLHIQ